MWTARTTAKKAHQYVEHMIRRVFPSLPTMEGHQEIYLLRRKVKDAIESALTLGESLDAVRRFAGMALDNAVVGPEARAILTNCGDPVTHSRSSGVRSLCSPSCFCSGVLTRDNFLHHVKRTIAVDTVYQGLDND